MSLGRTRLESVDLDPKRRAIQSKFAPIALDNVLVAFDREAIDVAEIERSRRIERGSEGSSPDKLDGAGRGEDEAASPIAMLLAGEGRRVLRVLWSEHQLSLDDRGFSSQGDAEDIAIFEVIAAERGRLVISH
jgi:hypothetical protein